MRMDLPKGIDRLIGILKKGLKEPSRGAFVWVGAGLSMAAGYPSLGQLAERLRQESLEPLGLGLEAFQIIDAFVTANGRGALEQILTDVFIHKSHLEFHRDLVCLPWKGIITTNYDELLEDALKGVNRPYLKVTLDRNLDLTAGPRVPLFKVHGDIADFKSVVLDGKSYENFNKRYPLLKADMESYLRKHSLVFFGCSMRDPRLLDWLRKLGKKGREKLMPSCTVMTERDWDAIPDKDRQLLGEGNIKPVLLKSHADIPDLLRQLAREVLGSLPGKSLYFKISSLDRQQWQITHGDGTKRSVDVPWKVDTGFDSSLVVFEKMARNPVLNEKSRSALYGHAVKVGEGLGKALLREEDCRQIRDSIGQGGSPPLMTIESGDDLILSLPWELLRMDGEFAVRESRVDIVRTVPSIAATPMTLSPPDRYLKLVVNVSAPEEGSGPLNYEAESYRLLRALHDHSEVVFTNLGTVDDLVQEVTEHEPIGIHFSGHGAPGVLLFEDEEGGKVEVSIAHLLQRIRTKAPSRFHSFFYLASCYGNTPAMPKQGQVGSGISAAHLHREGIIQVIGYYGPIVDELSTLAELALYQALGQGKTTTHGVRQARAALVKGAEVLGTGVYRDVASKEQVNAFPFAWAQLVLYHRGPDHPLSLKLPQKYIQQQEAASLKRTFHHQTGQRRFLSTGFIGRRRQLHQFRKAYFRKGQRVLVFQGLGGLGKTTLAGEALRILPYKSILTIWCHEIKDNQAQGLTSSLSEFGQTLLGPAWITISREIDRTRWASEADRFRRLLKTLLEQGDHLVIYLDNMESLLKGPDNEDHEAFGQWRSTEVEAIWNVLKELNGDKLTVIGSCRYRNATFEGEILHVPEMGKDAILRMMGWFEGLRQLSSYNRESLVKQLYGHPRAVEFLNDLILPELKKWEDRYGEWVAPRDEEGLKQEWQKIIEPALPDVERRLGEDLLLKAIWERVLDELCQRMLFRMTCLVRPWDWNLMMELGEPGEQKGETEKTAMHLRRTSLLGEVQEWLDDRLQRLFQLHPATSKFIESRFEEKEAEALRLSTYHRVGTYLEQLVRTSEDIQNRLDGGHYLFECREFDRACDLLEPASKWLLQRGRLREAISVLLPFEEKGALPHMSQKLKGLVLGSLGNAYWSLGQVKDSIGYYEQALTIATETKDRTSEGVWLGNLGNAYGRLGQVKKAVGYYEQALTIATETKDRISEGVWLGNLGNAHGALGQVEKSIDYYEQALAIARETKDRRNEGVWLGNLGNAYGALGQVKESIGYFEQALAIAKETNNRTNEGWCLGNLGGAHRDLGQVEKSIGYYEQALTIATETKDRISEGVWLGNLGNAHKDLGQVEKSIDYYEQALTIAKETNDRRSEGRCLDNIGIAYRALGKVKKAVGYYEQALTIATETNDRIGEGWCLGDLGNAYRDLGQVDKARQYLLQALLILEEVKSPDADKVRKWLEELEKQLS